MHVPFPAHRPWTDEELSYLHAIVAPPRHKGGAKIMITPEMVKNGTTALCGYDPDRDNPREALRIVLVAVFGADVVTFHTNGTIKRVEFNEG